MPLVLNTESDELSKGSRAAFWANQRRKRQAIFKQQYPTTWRAVELLKQGRDDQFILGFCYPENLTRRQLAAIKANLKRNTGFGLLAKLAFER